jgi:hypothetical protein
VPPRLPIAEARERVKILLSRPPMYGPPTEPCVCTAGRHEHAGASNQGACKRTGCRRYRRDLVDLLVEQAIAGHRNTLGDDLRQQDAENQAQRAARHSEGEVRVSASDHSTCRRQVQYRERPPEDFYGSWTDKRAAYMGQLIHDAVATLRQRLYPWRQFEQPVKIDGIGESRFDEYDPIMGSLDDLKTAGDYKWSVITDDGPPESEWKQAFTYALSKHREGEYVRVVRIVYVQRADGRDVVFERPWNLEYAERAVDDLITLATQIELGIEQPRDEPGPAASPICARYCFARDYCWNVPQAERAGRSPESWTLLGADPDDERIAALLVDYAAARDDKGAAGKRQDAAKALLDGIAFGEYGEMRYGRDKPRAVLDEQAWEQAVVEWALTPEGLRGPLKELHKPTREGTQGSIAIRKIPKAEREKRAKAAAVLAEQQRHAAEVALMGEVDGPYPTPTEEIA